VLDPLRVLGSHLEDVLFGLSGHHARNAMASGEFLRVLGDASVTGGSKIGDPGAPLTRLEFYRWLDAASQTRVTTAAPTWKRLRQRMARQGVSLPAGRTADSSPVSVEEAQDALSRLLAADRLPRVAESSRVAPGDLRQRSLPVPAPSLSGGRQWPLGPAPAISRGAGAGLVLAARSCPFAAGAAPYRPSPPKSGRNVAAGRAKPPVRAASHSQRDLQIASG